MTDFKNYSEVHNPITIGIETIESRRDDTLLNVCFSLRKSTDTVEMRHAKSPH